MDQLYDTELGQPRVPLRATTGGALLVAVVSGGGGGGGGGSGTSDTTEATQLLVKAAVQSLDAKTPALSGGKVPVTDPTALPLPVGAATSALQDTANVSLSRIDGKIPALVAGRTPVDGSGVTQPVSASSLPLPTGAATEATLAAASGKLPASLGSKAGSASLSVTTATGDVTSISGTVTTGGTAQELAAANSARRGMTLQNNSTGELRVSPFGTASAAAGYRVSAGDLLVLDSPHCGVGAVSVWGSTTGQAFVGGEAV